MNLVAAAKLGHARTALRDAKPFFDATRQAAVRLIAGSAGVKHVYLGAGGRVRRPAIVVICGDRGLCGGYNVNVCKAAHAFIKSRRDEGSDVSLITVGSKARDYFIRRRERISESFTGVSEDPSYDAASRIGESLLDAFAAGGIDGIYLAYTEFKSVVRHDAKVMGLLPADPSDHPESSPVNYDSDPESILDYIIPKYVNTIIYGAMLESAACEQGARMTSMESATDNADEMISKLTLSYNRARQSAITQEITEIVSGAGAAAR
jgi:F-type H+-transporting ATPase subunit gamma